MPKIILPQKQSGDLIPTVFDFASYMASADTISSAECTVTVYSGTDSNPSALLSGSESISGTQVTQKLTGGVAGVTYSVSCAATYASGQITTLTGFLSILPGSI